MKRATNFIFKIFKVVYNGYADAFAKKTLSALHDCIDHKNFHACYALAGMYESGTRAVKKDLIKAYSLYAASAENKITGAQEKLHALELIMPHEELVATKKYDHWWLSNDKLSRSALFAESA